MLPWYLNATASTFWTITPENKFKWFNYEAAPGDYAAAADVLRERHVGWARQHGFDLVRGHTLDW